MKRIGIGFISIVCALFCAFGLSGCNVRINENGDMEFITEERALLGEGEAAVKSFGSSAQEPQKADLDQNKTIGAPFSSETERMVSLLNLTGRDVTGVSLKSSKEEEFGENLLPKGEAFSADEVRDLYFDPREEETAGLLQYDLKLTFEDGAEKVLHSFPFYDMTLGRICLQDEVLFLDYVSSVTQEEVITRKAESVLLEEQRLFEEKSEEEQLAAEEAARKAAEEAEAALAAQQWAEQQWAEQQAAQQWVEQQPVYTDPQPAADAGCINDASLLY